MSTFSRKDFFRKAALKARGAAADLLSGYAEAARAFEEAGRGASAGAVAEPFLRPPGAVEEATFLAACTRCDDCVKACPHWVIKKAGPELPGAVAGTPVIVPKENPCLMCRNFPCAVACPAGALAIPESGAFVAIGIAVVDADSCYLAQKQPCDYCFKECPERPRAVRLPSPGAPAEILADACTGCGKCAQICPGGAISIERREPS